MNLIIPSKSHLISALLAAAVIFVILSLPISTELFVGYTMVSALLVMAGFEYRTPRSYRGNK